MGRASNNNPMLMSGGSSFLRLTLRSRLFPMAIVTKLTALARMGCVFRTCPGEFYGKLVCTVTSTNDTTLLLILPFFHSSLVVVRRSSRGRSRRVTRQPESIAFFLGGGRGGFSADWQRIREDFDARLSCSVSLETVLDPLFFARQSSARQDTSNLQGIFGYIYICVCIRSRSMKRLLLLLS